MPVFLFLPLCPHDPPRQPRIGAGDLDHQAGQQLVHDLGMFRPPRQIMLFQRIVPAVEKNDFTGWRIDAERPFIDHQGPHLHQIVPRGLPIVVELEQRTAAALGKSNTALW
jgi:hypothetical protein